jgi:hypothetical protein
MSERISPETVKDRLQALIKEAKSVSPMLAKRLMKYGGGLRIKSLVSWSVNRS